LRTPVVLEEELKHTSRVDESFFRRGLNILAQLHYENLLLPSVLILNSFFLTHDENEVLPDEVPQV
jgi:hypothetical protein